MTQPDQLTTHSQAEHRPLAYIARMVGSTRFPLPARGWRGLRYVLATLLVAFAVPQIAVAAPSVTITSPSAGAVVKGTVKITAQATGGPGETMSSVAFFDGVRSIGTASCQGQGTC